MIRLEIFKVKFDTVRMLVSNELDKRDIKWVWVNFVRVLITGGIVSKWQNVVRFITLQNKQILSE